MHRLYIPIFLLCLFQQTLMSTSPLDSLISMVAFVPDDDSKVALYNEIAYQSYRSDPSNTFLYANKAIKLATVINDDFGKVVGLKNRGIAQYFLNEPKAALTSFLEVIRLSEEKGYKHILYKALNNAGIIYRDMGQLEEAISAFQRAVLTAKMDGNQEDYCFYTTNLADLLIRQEKFDRAYRTYSQVYPIALKLKNKILIADIRAGMAQVLFHKKRYKECLIFYSEVLKLYQKLNDKGGQILTLTNIGNVYEEKGEGREALKYYSKGLELAEKFGASTLIITCYQSLAQSTLKSKKYKKAIKYAELGLDHAELVNNIQMQISFFEVLATAHEARENFQKGLLYFKKLKVLEDDLRKNNEAQKIAKLALDYDLESQEAENQMLRDKQALQQAELKKNKIFAVMIGLGLIFVSLLAYFLFCINKQKLKFNVALRKEVDNRTKQLEQSNFKLKKSYKELERFSHIASHDLKEPLRNITSFVRLIERRLVGENEYLKEYLQFVQNNAKQMNILIEDVLEFSKIDNKQVKLERVDLNKVLKQVRTALRQEIKKGDIFIESSELPTIVTNSGQLYLILKNLIENGIRFNKNPIKRIKVSYLEEGQNHILRVKDNGIGIDANYHEKIFEMFERLQNRKHYRGSGLGLSLCKKIIEGWGGEIWIENNDAGGSIFYLKFPVRKTKKEETAMTFKVQPAKQKESAPVKVTK